MSITLIPLNPAWKAQAGPPVSPCAPQEYSMQPVLDVAVFSVSGTTVPEKYPGAEWYQAFPIPLGATAVCHSWDMELSSSAAEYSQAEECDCIFTGPMVSPGKAYRANRSFEFAGTALQIADVNGKWVTFATMPSKLSTGVTHRIQVFHAFNFTKTISSTVAVAVDGTLYPVPLNLQNIPMTLDDWTDYNEVMIQKQSDLTSAGGAYSVTVGKMEMIWNV
jgi:hypothetical protein